MNPFPVAAITNAISALAHLDIKEVERCRHLREGVPGWSDLTHYIVFKELLKAKPNASWLVAGVYHGLDLRMLSGIADDLGQTPRLVGVDLFADEPCADWAPENKGKSWEEAVKSPPPDMEAARRNAPKAEIHKGDSVQFMERTAERFDIVYLDTAHDPVTPGKEIAAARRILKPGGLLGGDDYEINGWRVCDVVRVHLPHHVAFFNRIWVAQP